MNVNLTSAKETETEGIFECQTNVSSHTRPRFLKKTF